MRKLGIIYSPRLSASAAALALAVPLYRVGPDGFKSPAGRRAHLRGEQTINWGSTLNDGVIMEKINDVSAVTTALSKLQTLTILKNASVPALEATGEDSVARQWAAQGVVLCRKDRLSGGRGILKIAHPDTIPTSHGFDFFAKYWKKTHEYRFHVFARPEGDGWQGTSDPLPSHSVIDIQQKRRRTDWSGNYDPMIRNFDNGWVFCHDNIRGTAEELAAMGDTACKAVAALGLDFGAVDILARFSNGNSGNSALKKHVVCEINTAPGLEGQTLEKYVTAIRHYLSY